MEFEEMNAIIESADFMMDKLGHLTAWINLRCDGGIHKFGGYALYLPKSFKHHKMDYGYAGHFIWRVMEIAGVTEWSQLKGKCLRVRTKNQHVHAIAHTMEDDWFFPGHDFQPKNKDGK
ncbi:MAG: hypothetical protein ACLP05_01810 [Candidatus Kryptoniota bacterium]